MCEFSQKLIAWLDRELPVDETLEVELHLDDCAECGQELRTYERLSSALDAYCDAALESSAPHSEPSWKPAALGAGAVAAVLALVLASPHGRKTQSPTSTTIAAAAPASASRIIGETPRAAQNSAIASLRRRAGSGFRTPVESTGLPKPEDLSSIDTKGERDSSAKDTPPFSESVHRERNDNALNGLNVRATRAAAGWQSAEPAIQITIPAEAVLPPGAAPEGVSFVAEVSIGPDGLAHEIFLQP